MYLRHSLNAENLGDFFYTGQIFLPFIVNFTLFYWRLKVKIFGKQIVEVILIPKINQALSILTSFIGKTILGKDVIFFFKLKLFYQYKPQCGHRYADIKVTYTDIVIPFLVQENSYQYKVPLYQYKCSHSGGVVALHHFNYSGIVKTIPLLCLDKPPDTSNFLHVLPDVLLQIRISIPHSWSNN